MSLLQNEDFKTEAQLLAAGGAKSQLLNDTKVYISANAINKTLDDAIIDGDIGGGGQGGINYIDNYDFELNATGWGTYQDAAGERPVDATGGTATITLTRTTTTPLRGTASGLLSKPASNRQGEGGNYSFTIDTADQNKMQEIRFDYTVTTNYVDGYLRCFIIDVTNGTVIEPSQRDILASSGQATYIGYWQAPSNSTSYRLAFHVATNLTTAWDFKFDNVKVGPIQSGNAGTFVSDWQSYTPTTQGFGTISSGEFYFRRVGDSIELKGRFSVGVSTAAEARVGLPAGLVSSSSLLDSTLNLIGTWSRTAAPGTSQQGDVYIERNVTYLTFGAYSSIYAGLTKRPGNNISGTPEEFAFHTSAIPIQGWSTGVSASEIPSNQAIAFKAGLTANQIISSTAITKITFNTANSSTGDCFDTAGAFDTTNNRFVAPESGVYFFKTSFQFNANMTAAEYFITHFYKNGSVFRAQYHWNGGTSDFPQHSEVMRLNKGDYVEVFADSATDASYTIIGNDTAQGAYFEGFKINNPAQIAPTEVVACSYQTDAGQSIATATTTTILFEDRNFDTHNAMNTGTGIWTCPVSGVYYISAMALLQASTAWAQFEACQLYINVNSVQKARSPLELWASTGGGNVQAGPPPVFLLANLNRGDTVNVQIRQSSGSSISLNVDGTTNMINIQRIK